MSKQIYSEVEIREKAVDVFQDQVFADERLSQWFLGQISDSELINILTLERMTAFSIIEAQEQKVIQEGVDEHEKFVGAS